MKAFRTMALVQLAILATTAAAVASKMPSAVEALAAQTARNYAAMAASSLLRREEGAIEASGDNKTNITKAKATGVPKLSANGTSSVNQSIGKLTADGAPILDAPVPMTAKKPEDLKTADLLEVLEVTTQVWCGGDYKKTCQDCSRHGRGRSYCNGWCRWEPAREDCEPNYTMVWCGGHVAENCQQCVKSSDGSRFFGSAYCNGECYWQDNEEYVGGLYGDTAEKAWWIREKNSCVPRFPNPPPFTESTRRRDTRGAKTAQAANSASDKTNTTEHTRKKLHQVIRKPPDAQTAAQQANDANNPPRGDTATVYYGGSVERRNITELEKIFWATKAFDKQLAEQPTYFREDGSEDLQAIAAFKVIAFLVGCTLVIALVFLVLVIANDPGYDAIYRRKKEEAGLKD
jgi:type II secretory pathway pseudopilin PulG